MNGNAITKSCAEMVIALDTMPDGCFKNGRVHFEAEADIEITKAPAQTEKCADLRSGRKHASLVLKLDNEIGKSHVAEKHPEDVYDQSSLTLEQLMSGRSSVGTAGSRMITRDLQEQQVRSIIEKGSVATSRAAALAALTSLYGWTLHMMSICEVEDDDELRKTAAQWLTSRADFFGS